METVGDVILVTGAALSVIAAVGVLRFGDLYSRMHAAAKVTTLSLGLVVLGAQFTVTGMATRATLVLAFVLQLLSAPVGAHLLGRSSYGQRGIAVRVDTVDEFGRDLSADDPPGDRP